jgi:hypothetical protein
MNQAFKIINTEKMGPGPISREVYARKEKCHGEERSCICHCEEQSDEGKMGPGPILCR